MKILIISNHAYPAQGPRAFRTTELSEQLVKMGHEVVLYTVQGKYDYTQYENNLMSHFYKLLRQFRSAKCTRSLCRICMI